MTDVTLAGARARAARTRAQPPAWWPERWYYGWALVGTLGMTAIASYGILSYGFAAFIVPMGVELGWSKSAVTGAFSLAQLVAGVMAIPVGHWLDRHGARGLMTAGAALATLLLVAWAQVTSLAAFYAIWAGMGVAMAAVLYEPAFAVINTWFVTDRRRALTILTFLGGFASVVFVPLATAWVARDGWRQALLMLAGLYAILAVLPHAWLLRRHPHDLGIAPDGARLSESSPVPLRTPLHPLPVTRAAPAVSVRDVLNVAGFRWTAAAFTLSGLTSTAITVHLVPLLLERGYSASFAGGAMGVLGLMALPGRLIFTPLGGRWRHGAVAAAIFTMQALALLTLLAVRGGAGVWTFVVLFGAGFGAITPARAALVGELVPAATYGRVSGVLALLVSVARAVAPVGASVLYAAAGGRAQGYGAVLATLVALCVLSALAVLRIDATASPHPAPSRVV